MNPAFQSILVSLTEGCHVGCHHCGFAGSRRDRSVTENEITDWVAQVCAYGIPVVIFTGGEPFEVFDILRAGVWSAHRFGVPTALFTSSFWGESHDAAVAQLEQLPGLEHLYLSSDVYHQRRVPYDHVFNVITAADQVGVKLISICITHASDEEREAVRSHYRRFGNRVNFFEERVIPTPFMRESVLEHQSPLMPPDQFGSTCWIDTPIVNPTGDVFSCHAGKAGAHGNLEHLPYWLGTLHRNSFVDIMAAARERLDYQYLRTHGPKGIAALLKAYPDLAQAVSRDGFTGACDMCMSVLSKPEGVRALREHVQRPEVIFSINMALAFRFGEPPLIPSRSASAGAALGS
jgi:organic radical activating enzyme